MRNSAAYFLVLVTAIALALSGGCGTNAIEGHTRPTLMSINGGAPLHSDVFVFDSTLVGGGYIPQEAVEFTFSNPPSQKFMDLAPEDPYGTFIIDSYTVRYEVLLELTGGPGADFTSGELPVITNPVHIALPVDSDVMTSLVIAPGALKLESPIVDLMPGGTAPNGELVVRAEITFTGHEQGSTNVQSLEGSTTILFANYADESD